MNNKENTGAHILQSLFRPENYFFNFLIFEEIISTLLYDCARKSISDMLIRFKRLDLSAIIISVL